MPFHRKPWYNAQNIFIAGSIMTKEIDYSNNPLHGLSLKQLTTELVEHYGFTILYAYLNINCFKSNPSVKSSLTFLRKTPWARKKVEELYISTLD